MILYQAATSRGVTSDAAQSRSLTTTIMDTSTDGSLIKVKSLIKRAIEVDEMLIKVKSVQESD